MGGKKPAGGVPRPDAQASPASGTAPPRRSGFRAMRESWQGAKDMFYPLRLTKKSRQIKSIDEVLRPLLRLSDMRLALALVLLAGLITALLAFATTYESLQLANFQSEALSQVTGIAGTALTFADLGPVALFQFLLYVPVGFVAAVAGEALAFGTIKATGGKGTFTQQLYMASVAGLALSFASVLSLFGPLTCLFQFASGLALAALSVYILFYVIPKAYVLVHDIGFGHALAVSLVLTLVRLAALVIVTNSLAVMMGFPPPIDFSAGA